MAEERKNSEARIKANNKYNAKAYDRINIAVAKGKKEIISAHATAQGESLNAFVNKAIDEKLDRDDKHTDNVEHKGSEKVEYQV